MAKKVILVEDDEFIREIYTRQLKLEGIEAVAYANGKDGMAAITQGQVDLVLLDIMLPDTNGLEILKTIKQTETLKQIPVVMLTNLGQDEVIREGFRLGAAGYMVKAAYNPDQIIDEIRNILEGKTNQTAPV